MFISFFVLLMYNFFGTFSVLLLSYKLHTLCTRKLVNLREASRARSRLRVIFHWSIPERLMNKLPDTSLIFTCLMPQPPHQGDKISMFRGLFTPCLGFYRQVMRIAWIWPLLAFPSRLRQCCHTSRAPPEFSICILISFLEYFKCFPVFESGGKGRWGSSMEEEFLLGRMSLGPLSWQAARGPSFPLASWTWYPIDWWGVFFFL